MPDTKADGLSGGTPSASTEEELPPAEEKGSCWVCGAAVDERHCKIICTRCGFMRDCSDP